MQPMWEARLLSLAQVTTPEIPSIIDQHRCQVLDNAYASCEALTAKCSRSFYLASQFLPLEKRKAMRALYAFCRITDDMVDDPQGDARGQLAHWRQLALSAAPMETNLPALAWADARRRFQIPLHYARQLVDGVERDCYQSRYQSFEDLTLYAYGVASTVGLMSMYIIGFSTTEAVSYAIKLGVALQMTNILRDVGEDWRVGRCYLPAEELAAYGITEDELAAGRITDRWRAFMKFQIERCRQLYKEAEPGIPMLHRDGQLAVTAASTFYRKILNAIEAGDYDVFRQRAYVSGVRKLALLPLIWWRSR